MSNETMISINSKVFKELLFDNDFGEVPNFWNFDFLEGYTCYKRDLINEEGTPYDEYLCLGTVHVIFATPNAAGTALLWCCRAKSVAEEQDFFNDLNRRGVSGYLQPGNSHLAPFNKQATT